MDQARPTFIRAEPMEEDPSDSESSNLLGRGEQRRPRPPRWSYPEFQRRCFNVLYGIPLLSFVYLSYLHEFSLLRLQQNASSFFYSARPQPIITNVSNIVERFEARSEVTVAPYPHPDPLNAENASCHLPLLKPFDDSILKFVENPKRINCSAVPEKKSKKFKYNLLFDTDYYSNLIMLQNISNFGFESCCYKNFSRKSETSIKYSDICIPITSSKVPISEEHEFIIVYCLPDSEKPHVTSAPPQKLTSAAPATTSTAPKNEASVTVRRTKRSAKHKATKLPKPITSTAPATVTTAVPQNTTTKQTTVVPTPETTVAPTTPKHVTTEPKRKSTKAASKKSKTSASASKKQKTTVAPKVETSTVALNGTKSNGTNAALRNGTLTITTPNSATSSAPKSAISSAPKSAKSSIPKAAISSPPKSAKSATPKPLTSSAPLPATSLAPKSATSSSTKSAKSAASSSTKSAKSATSSTTKSAKSVAPKSATSSPTKSATSLAPKSLVSYAVPKSATSSAPQFLTSSVPKSLNSTAIESATSSAPNSTTTTSSAPISATTSAPKTITSSAPKIATTAKPKPKTTSKPKSSSNAKASPKKATAAPPVLKPVDMFHFVRLKPEVEARIGALNATLEQVNVLVIGLDSVSHMNLIRTMPKTYQYLTNELGAIGMDGYTKVGDNTFSNMVPAFMGLTLAELEPICWSKTKRLFFDKCPLIWKNFSEEGYRTSFAEDAPQLAIFNSRQYLKKGFDHQPTDYYLRTLMYTMEDLMGHTSKNWLCYGPRMAFSILMDNIKRIAQAMGKDRRYFQLTWATSLFHDFLNFAALGDADLRDTLRWLNQEGHLVNTVLILMSDHGIRFGPIRKTFQGKVEERMPLLYYSFPNWFKLKYASAVNNMKLNRNRLTTPFDFHETLKDLLHLKNIEDAHLKERTQNRSSTVQPRGISLFSPIPVNRTCESAAIERQYCVCHKMEPISVKETLVQEAATAVVEKVNEMLVAFPLCSKLSLKEVSSAQVMQMAANSSEAILSSELNPTWYSVTLTTIPGNAVFEATVSPSAGKHPTWSLSGKISRINTYGTQGECVKDYELKLYCFCK